MSVSWRRRSDRVEREHRSDIIAALLRLIREGDPAAGVRR
jgi:hypothetical protein